MDTFIFLFLDKYGTVHCAFYLYAMFIVTIHSTIIYILHMYNTITKSKSRVNGLIKNFARQPIGLGLRLGFVIKYWDSLYETSTKESWNL